MGGAEIGKADGEQRYGKGKKLEEEAEKESRRPAQPCLVLKVEGSKLRTGKYLTASRIPAENAGRSGVRTGAKLTCTQERKAAGDISQTLGCEGR